MPTLLSGGNIFPVGPKLRPGWLGAALRVQKLSWICFLRVLHLPSSWPFPFPDYNFCTAQKTSWHQLGSKPTDLFGVKWKKITNERRKKSKCWKKKIFEHLQSEMFWLRGWRQEETCTVYAKTSPKLPYLHPKSSGHLAEMQQHYICQFVHPSGQGRGYTGGRGSCRRGSTPVRAWILHLLTELNFLSLSQWIFKHDTKRISFYKGEPTLRR